MLLLNEIVYGRKNTLILSDEVMLMLENQLLVDNLCKLHLIIINHFVELPFFIKFLTGQVDKRTLEKNQTEAREKLLES